MNKPIQFRIYPETDRKKYAIVLVFKDRAEMYAYDDVMAGFTRSVRGMKFFARSWFYKPTTHGKHKGNFGQVLLYRDRLGHGIVEHELSHLALFLCGYKVKKLSDEERYCETVQNLCVSFWRKYFKVVDRIEAM